MFHPQCVALTLLNFRKHLPSHNPPHWSISTPFKSFFLLSTLLFKPSKLHVFFHNLSSQQIQTLIHPSCQHPFWAVPSINPYSASNFTVFISPSASHSRSISSLLYPSSFDPLSPHPLANNSAACSLYTSSHSIWLSTPVSTIYSEISSILLSTAATSITEPSSIYSCTPLQPCPNWPNTCSIIKHLNYDNSSISLLFLPPHSCMASEAPSLSQNAILLTSFVLFSHSIYTCNFNPESLFLS